MDDPTAPTDRASAVTHPTAAPRGGGIMFSVLRIVFGWVLLWAGLDKVFGFGFPTESGRGVIDGVSPTEGYLTHGINPDGPAYEFLNSMAGNIVVDVLYLASTLGAGLALVIGVMVRPAAFGALLLMLMLWLGSLPLDNNPIVDQHLAYAVIAVTVMVTSRAQSIGLGRWWNSIGVVRANPWLA